jgi:hypothetical protein
MTRNVLLVTADAALRGQLETALGDQTDITLLWCGNDARGVQIVRDSKPDYVITSLALARDSKSPVDEFGGLDFAKAVSAISPVPITVITPSPIPDAVIDRLGILGPTVKYCPVGPGLATKVLDRIRSEKPPRKVLDIVVRADEQNHWDYEMRGENFQYPFERRGQLHFDEGAQYMCKFISAKIGEMPPDWHRQFEELGKSIVLSLFPGNNAFENEVRDGLREAGGLPHTRVTFVVGEDQYEIALEAVFPPVKPARYPWMIFAPLVRNIRGQVGPNSPLFDTSRRSKRCLIVGASTDGTVDDIAVNGASLRLAKLTHVKAECDAVEAVFRKAQREIGFEDPKVVGTDPQHPLGKDEFLDLLQEPWDVIHFAGHAYHSPPPHSDEAPPGPQRACLFVGPPGTPVPIEMNTIAPSMRDTTRLLYLSGCKSANAGFTVSAAHYGVPAVIGFRWSIGDGPAALHACLFYRQLFRKRAIDTAFRNTRRGMRRIDATDNAWASGILVMARQ